MLFLPDFIEHPIKRNVSLVAQSVKNSPSMWETRVQSLGWEDPLEKAMAPHSSTLAWRTPSMERGAWWATVHGVAKSWTGLTERTEQVLAVACGVSFYCITRALSLQHTSDLQTLQLWPTGSVAPKHVRF